METPITQQRGMSMTGYPPDIDINLFVCINAISKKYTFASLENCSIRFFGKNVSKVYLEVLILLFLYSLGIYYDRTSKFLKLFDSSWLKAFFPFNYR
jgi:hypothetical protein